MEKYEYTHPSGKLTVIWQQKKCFHSGICVKTLPQVYDPKARPWVKPEYAAVEQLKEQIGKCPSGALSYRMNDENTDETTEIKQINNEKNGVFEICYQGKKAGLMTYIWSGSNKFIINHTEVDPAYEGKGFAKQLVLAGVAYARESSKKIIPLCPYAKAIFQKRTDLQDVMF
jgi:predicted GNAT family acetyltransferase/uncharacterized Fe-S cluster protein YjdI